MADPIAKHHPAERAAYRYMDAFRFIAALVVVLGHARDFVWVDAVEADVGGLAVKALYFLLGLGHEAVMVFFVLSGFWITHAVERRVESDRFWSDYLTDRLSRLLIVIVPALLVGGLLDLAGAAWIGAPQYFGGTGAHTNPANVFANLTPAVLAGNLLFLQNLLVPPFGSNGPLWSLAYEFWYYIWFAAAARAFRGRFSFMLVALAVGLIWPKMLPGFVVWLIGSGLYYFDRRYLLSRRAMRPLLAAAFCTAGLGLLAAALVVAALQLVVPEVANLAVGLSFATLLWGLLRSGLRFPRSLAPVAAYGAQASFSLYVLHYPLVILAVAVIGLEARLQPSAASLALLAALSLGAVLAGWLFSRATELQTGRLRKAVKARLPMSAEAD